MNDLLKLFDAEPDRVEQCTLRCGSLLLDVSKQPVSKTDLAGLGDDLESKGFVNKRQAMFDGEAINETEDRAVLHVALRDVEPGEPFVDTPMRREAKALVLAELAKLEAFATGIRKAGKIKDVVNIGIGGSDLGPKMVTRALSPYHDGPRCHYVSNVDAAHLYDVLAGCDPKTTLFIVASKTFTTMETMMNARSARAWLVEGASGGDGERAVKDQFCALSTNLEAVAEFGISAEQTFGFWDWVGGRYSVWSAIGLSVMIAVGADGFRAFLAGAAEMDKHFLETPLNENLPVAMALTGIANRTLGRASLAVIPYEQRLEFFPAYLQQLEMESNGKSVLMDGGAVKGDTCPVVWGEPGTNGQHAFFQLLHQGTDIIPVDFLVGAVGQGEDHEHQQALVANCIAQSEALMVGTAGPSDGPLKGHRRFPGGRPSSTLIYDQLDPHMLGMLIALYEHKVFTQSVYWGINAFDQWGVELGKVLAKQAATQLSSGSIDDDKDPSTKALLNEVLERLTLI